MVRDARRTTYRLGPALIDGGRTAESDLPALEFGREVMTEVRLELHLRCVARAVRDGSATELDQAIDPEARGVGLRPGGFHLLRRPFGTGVLALSGFTSARTEVQVTDGVSTRRRDVRRDRSCRRSARGVADLGSRLPFRRTRSTAPNASRGSRSLPRANFVRNLRHIVDRQGREEAISRQRTG